MNLFGYLLMLISAFSCLSGKGQSDSKNIIQCDCFDGIGSLKGDKPIIAKKFSNGRSVILCGFYDKEMRDSGLIISEFNIFDCISGKVLVEYSAIQICRIEETNDSIIIEELKYLPVGSNWRWELFQIGEQIISAPKDILKASKKRPKLGEIQIENSKQTEFLNSLKRGSGINENVEHDLGKLEVLSLIGNVKAWQILKNYEEFIGKQVDGAIAEQLNEAISNISWLSQYYNSN